MLFFFSHKHSMLLGSRKQIYPNFPTFGKPGCEIYISKLLVSIIISFFFQQIIIYKNHIPETIFQQTFFYIQDHCFTIRCIQFCFYSKFPHTQNFDIFSSYLNQIVFPLHRKVFLFIEKLHKFPIKIISKKHNSYENMRKQIIFCTSRIQGIIC